MPRDTRRTAVPDYLSLYPDIAERWINRCGLCDRVGYKPGMPDDARGAHYLKHELEPLALDDLGRCDPCAAGANRLGSRPRTARRT